nr:hypothetical protein MFLOJ_01940 [Mycobacterium florentinum]
MAFNGAAGNLGVRRRGDGHLTEPQNRGAQNGYGNQAGQSLHAQKMPYPPGVKCGGARLVEPGNPGSGRKGGCDS